MCQWVVLDGENWCQILTSMRPSSGGGGIISHTIRAQVAALQMNRVLLLMPTRNKRGLTSKRDATTTC